MPSADMRVCPFCGFLFDPNITYAGEARKRPSGRKKGFCKKGCMTKFFSRELRHRRDAARKRALETKWRQAGQAGFFSDDVGRKSDAVL